MPSSAKAALGTKIYIGGTDGPPRTDGVLVEEVQEIDLPEGLAEQLDVTSHDSTAAEFLSTYLDEGTITLDMNWTSATGQDALLALVGAAASAFYVNLAGGNGQLQMYFSGNVHFRKFGMGRKAHQALNVKIKITGPVSFSTQA